MNNASMTILINGKPEHCFITRNNFNKLLRNGKLECTIVTKPGKNNEKLYWVATLTIF